ncbi:MAG: MopE-related protein [Saprospiraceae bacterium]
MCGTSTSLAANAPGVGSGTWTEVAGDGNGVFGDASSPTSSFSGTAGQAYTLRWTVTNAPCPTSTDDVMIAFVESPTPANAGADQTLCGTSTNLAANTPTVGSGSWSEVAGDGNGVFANATDPVSMFSGTAGVTYTLRWAIENAPCPASTDDVDITFVGNPTTSNAGPDQNVCGISTMLAANNPTVGTGEWSVISGAGGMFGDINDPASSFTGVAETTYVLRWTITNAPCSPSFDDVTVTLYDNPTAATAGPDQNICPPTTTLEANTPTVGTGAWSIISGDGNGMIADASNPNSSFSGTGGQSYTLRWTVSNDPCNSSSDDVEVTFLDNLPTPTLDVCVLSNGDYSVSGGTGPYTWEAGFLVTSCPFGPGPGCNFLTHEVITLTWSPLGTGAAVNPPTPGATSIRVRDANPCNLNTFEIASLMNCCMLEVTCPANTNLGAYDCTTLGNVPTLPINQAEAEASPYNIVFGNMPCGTIMVSASDNMTPNTCSGAAQTITRTVFIWDDLAGGTPGVFDAGTEESSTCTFTYTVQPDNTPPDLVCPSDQTIEWVVGFNTAPVGANTPQDPSLDPAVTGVPMASDGCGIGEVPTNCTTISGPVTNLNYDALGLISTNFVINGVTPIPPALTCVHEVCVTVHMVADIGGIGFEQSNIRDEAGNVIGQNGNSNGDCEPRYAYSTMCIPVAAYNTYAADGTLDFSIDTDGDIDNICATQTIQASVEICSACGPGLTYQDVITGPTPANCPDLWVVERTWTVVDQCGTPASCVQTFTFTDTTPPVVNTCSPDPAPIEWPTGFNTQPVGPNTPQDPSIDPSNYPNIVYSDNCAVVSVGYQDVITGPTPGNCPNLWIVERTWTVTDACGLTGNCVQTFTFTDTTPPTLANCPADPAPIEWPAGFNTAAVGPNTPQDPSIAPAQYGMPTASDNCGTPTVSYQDVITGPSPANCPNLWVVERTWTATDACGLTAVCTQIFTFTDTTPPSITTCPPTINVDGCGTADILNGGLTALPYSAAPATITEAEFTAEGGAASDNCAIVKYEYVDNASGTCPTVVTRVFTVTDVCGLTHTCTQLINIDDTTAPTVGCMDIPSINLTANGDLTITPAQVHDPAGDSDNCGTVSLVSVSPNSFTCQDEGSNTVTLTAEDACGNQGICTATVFIEDFITNLSATATDESCAGVGDGSVTASGTSGGGQLRYSLDGVNFQPSGMFANLSPGMYTVTFKVFGIPAVCAKTMTVTVAAGPPLETWYRDSDNDNWSDGVSEIDCVRPAGYKTSAELGGNTSGDCDDNNPAINPGAAEICDGLDNDCDGIVPADELDADGDGYRVCDNDCDDNNPAINPGAVEICNGIDDNCNGMIDEGISGLTYTGNVYFSTQAQVDAWPPCYSIIDGSVTIVGMGVNNLGPLSNIVDITGSLTIQTTGLTSMSGLDGLAHVGGTVTIYFNSSLTTLNGLEALNTVGGSLYIYYNFQLSNCCAISDLLSGGVSGAMVIFFNKAGCNSVLEIITTCPASPLVGNSGQLSDQSGYQLKEIEKATVYPNPTSGAFTVVLPKAFDKGKLIVTDITGRTMMRQDITEGQSIYQFERKGFTAGIYMVVIKPAGQPKQTIRLIIE